VTVTATDTTADISTSQTFGWSVHASVTEPSLTIFTEVLPGHEVEVYGYLSDNNPADAQVTLTGAISGTTTTDASGFFSYMTTSASLGSVTATATDQDSQTTSPVSASVSTPAPLLTMEITQSNQNTVTIAGKLTSVDASNQTITIAGIGSANVQTDANGYFTATLNVSGVGNLTATTTDAFGQLSNVATATLGQITQGPTLYFTVNTNSGNPRLGDAHEQEGSLPYLVDVINRTANIPELANYQFIIRFAPAMFNLPPPRINLQQPLELIRSMTINGTTTPVVLWAAGSGTALRVGRGTYLISNFVLTRATRGAVVNDGTLTLNNVTVEGNSTDWSGGGIRNYGTLTLNGCIISNNTAAFSGGGIANIGGTVVLQNGTTVGGVVGRNTAGTNGGGIYSEGRAASVQINSGCSVSGNRASGNGGGIYLRSGNLRVAGGFISNNNAGESGGGVYQANDNSAISNIINSIISGNRAAVFGGGFYYAIGNGQGMMTIVNCVGLQNRDGLGLSGGFAQDGPGFNFWDPLGTYRDFPRW
jgi:hypothetical protein